MTKMNEALTGQQAKILKFIGDYFSGHHYPPTRREIMLQFEFKSTQGVGHHLSALIKKGHLIQTGRGARNLDLPGLSVTFGIPIIKKVALGKPVISEENIQGRLCLDQKAAPWQDTYFMKVEDDNMMRAGILNGDYLLICPQPSAKDGDLVMALAGSESLIGYLTWGKDFVFFSRHQMDNDPIKITRGREGLRFLGKVTAVLRFLAGPLT